MTNVILRRRKLGKGSTGGIVAVSTKGLQVVRNWIDPFPANLALVFRWGCTSNVPEGVTTVNSAKSIHWCSDKREARLDMQDAEVSVPYTLAHEDFVAVGAEESYGLEGKWVSRKATHAQGRDLLVGTREELLLDSRFRAHSGGYVSRFIDKVAEYRVMVVQNRVVWVAKKTPGNPDQVAWNVAQGGRFDNVRWGDWPLRVVRAALAAAKVSGCDFCGVDVMVDTEGNPYVLEVNSAPSQTSEYRQRCVAKAFDYIIESGKSHFDDVSDGPRRTWKSYIHPAVRGNDD